MKVIYRNKMLNLTETEVRALLEKHDFRETYGYSESFEDGWVLYSGDENIWVQERETNDTSKKVWLVECADCDANALLMPNREMAEQQIYDRFWACVGFWNIKKFNADDNRIEIETKDDWKITWMILEV